jgi:hypothetical protein
MQYMMKSLAGLLIALSLMFGGIASAQADALDTYRSNGTIAERYDGYLELRGSEPESRTCPCPPWVLYLPVKSPNKVLPAALISACRMAPTSEIRRAFPLLLERLILSQAGRLGPTAVRAVGRHTHRYLPDHQH